MEALRLEREPVGYLVEAALAALRGPPQRPQQQVLQSQPPAGGLAPFRPMAWMPEGGQPQTDPMAVFVRMPTAMVLPQLAPYQA